MPDISVRLPSVSRREDVDAVVQVAVDMDDGVTERHEAIELLRRSNYPALTPLLLGILNNPNERELFRSWAAQHLGVNLQRTQDEQARAALHAAINDRHALVRREALLGLANIKDPEGIETASLWLEEKRPGVLDLCIRIVRDHNLRVHLPLIRSMVCDENEAVSRQAMVTVGEWNDQESRSVISPLAHSAKPLIRSAAQSALKKLDVGVNPEPARPRENQESENASAPHF